MAVDQKISQLPEALTLAEDDYVPIVQASSGLNKKAKVSAFVPDPSFIENIVFLTSADTILQIDKINWVTPTANHSIALPVADVSLLGKVLVVNNRTAYQLTVTGLNAPAPVILKGIDSIVGIACVTNGVIYGWEVFSRYNKEDFDLISQTITNGVTDKSPSENAVFDALALKLDLDGGNANQDIDIDGFGVNAKHFKVNGTGGAGHIGLKHQSANITASASESSIGADTVGDPVWKNDGGAIDKLELQSNKTTTVTGNESSTTKYLTVKGVYDWAVGLFATAYTTPNYYKVNFNTGSNVTGIAGRKDKPFATLQYVWDLIPNNNTTDIIIEIEGDYIATTHAIYEPSLVKHNITFTFLNDVTYSVNSTTISRPLFSFNQICNNLTFNVPSFTMTKQGGFIYTTGSFNHVYNFGVVTALTAINASINNNNFFIYAGSIYSNDNHLLKINVLNISITSDSNNLKNADYFFLIRRSIVKINEINITGGATVSSSSFILFYNTFKDIYIKKLTTNITYTNIVAFKILWSGATDNVRIDNFSTASNGTTRKSFALFEGPINKLSFGILNTLCYQPLLQDNGCLFLDLGTCTTNGVINRAYYLGQIVFNSINITGLSTDGDGGFFLLTNGASMIGGKITYNRNSSISNDRDIITLNGTVSKYITIGFELINTNQNATGRVFKPISYYGSTIVLCKNLIVSSNNDTNTDPYASWLQPYGDSLGHSVKVEGTVFTNYVKIITNFTNNADTTIITNYVG